MAHAAIEAVKKEFDKVEQSLMEKVAAGRVEDWADYKRVVGQIQECREGRARALEVVKLMLEAE